MEKKSPVKEVKIEDKRALKKALSVRDVMTKKYATIPFTGKWLEAFGEPERTGVWIIWGNSGNGKSTFALQLCAELCQHGKVLYNSLEEGSSLTFRNRLAALQSDMNGKRFHVVNEPISEMSNRLLRRRSADFIVIDSFQYSGLTYPQYRILKEKHTDKLLIFVSHAQGSNPAGRSANSVLYDASQKIWIEGFKAHSNGRSMGTSRSPYIIWEEEVTRIHGEKLKNE
jgi:nucleoside-triphosphatase THEP1